MSYKDFLFGTETHPAWWKLGIVGIQYLIVFIPLIIYPILTLVGASTSPSLIINTISASLLSAAVTTFLIGRWRGFGGGYFLPITSATPLFAAALLAKQTGDLGLIFGMSLVSGIIVILMSLAIRYLKFIFNITLAGFITMLLGIWVAVLGVDALFFPSDLTPLLFHAPQHLNDAINTNQTIIGLIALAAMLVVRLSSPKKHRLYCLLYGSVIGWLIALIFGQIDSDKLSLLQSAPWLYYPHPFSFVGYHFSTHLLLPYILGGFLISLQVFSMFALIDLETQADTNALNLSRCSKGNFTTGIALLVSSLLGSPQAPNPAAFGAQYATGIYSRRVAYVVSLFALLLSFSPKISALFLTIPAAVRGVSILFLGSGMFMAGLEVVTLNKLNSYQAMIFYLALLIGASFSIIPEFYTTTTVWIKGVTDPTFLIAVVTFIILNLFVLMRSRKSRK